MGSDRLVCPRSRHPVKLRIIILAAVTAVSLTAWVVASKTWSDDSELPAGRPTGNYFGLHPVGSSGRLPSDQQAAKMVRRSAREIRPGNTRYNQNKPRDLDLEPVQRGDRAYDPRWNRHVLARVDGNFIGTTDEILQWAAAKWGLPPDVLRAIAVTESDWNQANFGDYVTDRALCPPGYDTLPCPVTFGIVGAKSTSWPGLFPWNRDSTAAAVDVLGGWLRGCYEGWVWWLRDHGNSSKGAYAAGDLWGCVGAWYSGDWHDGTISTPSGERYIARVKRWYSVKRWNQAGY